MISYKAIFCSTLQKMLWNNYVQLRFQQTTKIVVYKWNIYGFFRISEPFYFSFKQKMTEWIFKKNSRNI